MKLEQVELRHITMPLKSPFTTSFGTEVERPCIIVTVHAGGLTGYGECVAGDGPWYSYETIGTAWHVLHDYIVPQILGQDVTDAADLWRRLARIRGHRMAISGVEHALWDLQGRAGGRPVSRMLG